jgi:hypothetical protein
MGEDNNYGKLSFVEKFASLRGFRSKDILLGDFLPIPVINVQALSQ